jgi:hypothetical protein
MQGATTTSMLFIDGYVSESLQKGSEIERGQGISEKLVTNQL